jgi:hypothetical protein
MSDNFAIACFVVFVAGIAVIEDSPWLAFFMVLVAADLVSKGNV